MGVVRAKRCTIQFRWSSNYINFHWADIAAFRSGPELPQQHRYRGRRNRPRLLAIPQIGGEKMKYIPDDYGECYRFDAFCKTVLRHEAMNYFRELNRQRKRAIQFSALCQHEMDKLCSMDEYPSDSILFTAYGYTLHIRDELVADAFASLPEWEQSILILYCVSELTDGEIGSIAGMSRSAVQRHRTKTLNELRKDLQSKGVRN